MQEGWGLWEVLWLYFFVNVEIMLWNTGGKNQVKNMCMHRVWSTHGFGECMGSVGRMV